MCVSDDRDSWWSAVATDGLNRLLSGVDRVATPVRDHMERRTGQLIAAAVGVAAVAAVAVVLLLSRDETRADRGESASSPDLVTTSSSPVTSSEPRSTSASLTQSTAG